MKPNLITLNLLVLLLLSWGCKKQNVCADEEYEFTISPETKEWLPEEILKDEIKYQSENGEIATFLKDTIYYGKFNYFNVEGCGDETKIVSVDCERITHRYNSGDSLYIEMEMNINFAACLITDVNETKWFEEVLVKMGQWNYDSTKILRTSVVNIVTKFISTDANEKNCAIIPPKFNETIQLQGESYLDVYTDAIELQTSAYGLSKTYFQKGKGIIAYQDGFGIMWVLV